MANLSEWRKQCEDIKELVSHKDYEGARDYVERMQLETRAPIVKDWAFGMLIVLESIPREKP